MGSNPIARSFYSRRRGQVGKARVCKTLITGSSPVVAFRRNRCVCGGFRFNGVLRANLQIPFAGKKTRRFYSLPSIRPFGTLGQRSPREMRQPLPSNYQTTKLPDYQTNKRGKRVRHRGLALRTRGRVALPEQTQRRKRRHDWVKGKFSAQRPSGEGDSRGSGRSPLRKSGHRGEGGSRAFSEIPARLEADRIRIREKPPSRLSVSESPA